MLSDCYSDLVPETGERLCCYDDVEDAAPRLPLATASFDEAADRLVVGDAAGVVWEINGGAKGALETHHQLGDAPLTRLEAVFRLPGSVNEPARPGATVMAASRPSIDLDEDIAALLERARVSALVSGKVVPRLLAQDVGNVAALLEAVRQTRWLPHRAGKGGGAFQVPPRCAEMR